MKQTVTSLTEHVDSYRGKYVCVSNVHTTVMAFRDEEYRIIQNAAAMTLPDGKPLSIVSRRRGFENAERVAGPDLMHYIMEISQGKAYRHFFYGSTPETMQLLEKNLRRDYSDINIVGMYSPPFRPLTEQEDKDIIQIINQAKPDYIWVALGAPKQEKWMYEHMDKVTGVMLGVGAAFDFCAGTVKRAPKWMQEMCLEWLFRIIQDPIRLIPRYVGTNFTFLWNVYRETKAFKKEKARLQKQKTKVAMIGHKRIPSREGGIEVVVEELAIRMVNRNCCVDAYNRSGYHVSGKKYNDKKSKWYNGIRIITIPTFRNAKLNAIVYSVLATLRALFGHYDVIHYHAEGPCVPLIIPKMFGIRVVATIHGLDWQRAKWGNFASKVLKLGEKIAAKHADEVIVLSQNVQQYFLDTYGRTAHYIPNGISKPRKLEANLIKDKYHLEKDGYILFLARLVPEKGLHYLVKAFEQTKTDKKLVIAGGSSHSMDYIKQVKEMIARDNRIIMTGFVQGELLEELYSNAYLFVLPSDVEGMSLSLLEAMSYGNCCLVSNIKENCEVVEQNAVTFLKSNSENLKQKLEHLLLHPDEVRKYKDTSSDFVCNKYHWDKIVEMTMELYKGGRK